MTQSENDAKCTRIAEIKTQPLVNDDIYELIEGLSKVEIIALSGEQVSKILDFADKILEES